MPLPGSIGFQLRELPGPLLRLTPRRQNGVQGETLQNGRQRGCAPLPRAAQADLSWETLGYAVLWICGLAAIALL